MVISVATAMGSGSGSIIAPIRLLEIAPESPSSPPDSIIYPIEDRDGDFISNPQHNPFDLDDPPDIEKEVEYDPETGTYIITETIGGVPYRTPTHMTFDEYWEYRNQQIERDTWHNQSGIGGIGSSGSGGTGTAADNSLINGSGLIPKINVGSEGFANFFGGDQIEIRPSGSIGMEIGIAHRKTLNPALPLRQQKSIDFLFNMDPNVGLTGKVGSKLNLDINYNPNSVFNFANQIKLQYTGNEDQIVQEISAGDVSFPLPVTLIPGAQSLFGIQTKLKFGRMTINTVLSQQRSQAKQITLENGAQIQEFEIQPINYDENRHFFLANYFRDNYEKALSGLPYINSPVIITRVEVYINDTRATPDEVQRDIVAFSDLGEVEPFNENTTGFPANKLPDNASNNLYGNLRNNPDTRKLNQVTSILESSEFGLQDVRDFKKTQARRLEPGEFTYDPRLGFISLNFSLRANEVIAVAYEFSTIYGGQYQVGEFSSDVFVVDEDNEPEVLYLKMLKSSLPMPDHPMWDLMMKNVYPLGAFQLEQEDFRLDIYYENAGGGDLRYIPEGEGLVGIPLIHILGLDQLNLANEPYPDGIFDFIQATRNFDNQQNTGGVGSNSGNNTQNNAMSFGTINLQNGRLYFPTLEPFGSDLREVFDENGNSPQIADKYAYEFLYDSTKFVAQGFPEFNRFYIRGEYKSNISSEISLGAFNIPRGSVRVTAGGRELTEDVDYIVDYNLGRLTLINEAYVNSGIPVNVSFEDGGTFGLQQRAMIGTRFDYKISEDFGLGATYMRLWERPYTQKVNYGNDPIANSMVGLDMNYYSELPWLTKGLDKLPGLETKEPSSITFNAEGAGLLPGHARAVNIDENGTIYIDDFEGSKAEYFLHSPFSAWQLASTPRKSPDADGNILFPEASQSDSLPYGYNRAKIAWYQVDNTFFNSSRSDAPDEFRQNHYARNILETEIFPERTSAFRNASIFPLNLAFYPSEKGPYNFDAEGHPGISAGVDAEGNLLNPEERWGGVMRDSPYKNFEASNVQFIEFWMLDPYIYYGPGDDAEGDLYIQIGNISEDVLKDSRPFYENGLPGPSEVANFDETKWGRVPLNRPVTNAFDNDEASREIQDVGFDGLTDAEEQNFFQDYLNRVSSIVNPDVLAEFTADPSSDNFYHFRDDIFDPNTVTINDRYKDYNGPHGNSPVQTNSDFSTSGVSYPEIEDLNGDDALNDSEDYFQYRVNLKRKQFMRRGQDYVADFIDVPNSDPAVPLGNDSVRWYYFRVPIDEYTEKVGNINLRNIESIRMFLTGFEQPVICRFAQFNLVRNNWRKYEQIIREEGEYQPANPDNVANAFFNVSAVSIEENSARQPVPYVVPPGITRQRITGANINDQLQNEQSILVQVGDLPDGEARGIFKSVDMDMRVFKRLRMYVHAEQLTALSASCANSDLEDGDVTAFVRIGDDFKNNFYEYEIPLRLTSLENQSEFDSLDRWVWPLENEVSIRLQDLVDTKIDRNFDPNANYNKAYVRRIERTVNGETTTVKITVVGSPDLGKVKQVMLGVRNPKRSFNTPGDDGFPKCAEVWFNELRLSDYDESAGWAALARMDVKLADLGNLAVSGRMHTAGFGTLDQRVHERYRDNYYEYDISANLELGKFLPEKSGIRIPVYAGISQSVSTPEYDPYDTDIRFEQNIDSIRAFNGNEAAKEAKKQRQSVSTIKSINVTNMRKERTNTERKPRFYDISNFNLSYSYTDEEKRDHIIESDRSKNHRATLAYNYSARPKYFEPFKKLIKSRSKWLSLIKDINFNFMPNSLSFQTDVNREFAILQLRTFDPLIDPKFSRSINKTFLWERRYGLQYNPTRSISLDFTAINNSIIDEEPNEETNRKELVRKFFRFDDRTRNYTQTANISYNVPLDKIPLLDWTQLRARYGTTYFWRGNPIQIADTLGNTVGNSQNIQLNAELNFTKLYNKSKYLKEVNSTRPSRQPPKKPKVKDPDEEDKSGKKKKRDKTGRPVISKGAKAAIRPLLLLRRISLTYNENNETVVPGFVESPQFFGMDWRTGGFKNLSPGWGFVFGYQPELRHWLEQAAVDSIITPNHFLNEQVTQSKTRSFTARANLEPFRDFKIDLNMNLNYSRNHVEFYKVDTTGVNAYRHLTKQDRGSYSISYVTWGTSFEKIDTQNISQTFRNFEDFRAVVSQRLGDANPNSNNPFVNPDGEAIDGYREGYGPYSQDVLLPAFIAAYTDKTPDKINLNPLNLFPLPNWRLTYNGLTKLQAFKKVFSSFKLTHAYSSTLTLNSFSSTLDFDDLYYDENIRLVNQNGIVDLITEEQLRLGSEDTSNLEGNFFIYYQVPDVVISEQFAPFLGVDMTFKNGLSLRGDYKRSRTLAMSLNGDYQLSDTRSEEVTAGLGYRIEGLTFPFKIGGKKLTLENEIQFNCDFSYRDNKTINYRLDQDISEPTSGMKTIRIAPSIDYVVNNQLRISLFYERTKNIPATSASFPNINGRGGLRINLSLQ